MKVFKDLKVGDTIYVGFEKKHIVKVETDSTFKNYVRIYTSDEICYLIPDYLSSHFDRNDVILISSEKEAIVEFYTNKLKELEHDYEANKYYLESWLKEAKELE